MMKFVNSMEAKKCTIILLTFKNMTNIKKQNEIDLNRHLSALRIKELDKDEVIGVLNGFISEMTMQLGYKSTTTKEVAYMASKVAKELSDKYKYLDLIEVKKAFQHGIRKKYGEYFGINAISLCIFIEKYTQSDERTEYVKSKQQEQKALPESCQLTDSEIEDINRKGIIRKFNQYVQNNRLTDYGSVAFLWLEENKFLNVPIEEKNKIFKKIKANWIPPDGTLKRLVDETLKQSDIVNQCRLYCLKKYFDELIEFNVNIEDLITKK